MNLRRYYYPSCSSSSQLRVAGTPCRGSMDSCDLPEYCNGRDGSCPEDYYLMDGLPCRDAYCYEGRCQTYDFQCRKLFAPGAQADFALGGAVSGSSLRFFSVCFLFFEQILQRRQMIFVTRTQTHKEPCLATVASTATAA